MPSHDGLDGLEYQFTDKGVDAFTYYDGRKHEMQIAITGNHMMLETEAEQGVIIDADFLKWAIWKLAQPTGSEVSE